MSPILAHLKSQNHESLSALSVEQVGDEERARARLSLHNVTAPFGLTQPISAHLRSGMCALVGPNGAGKSTLLRLMCGLISPSSGVVRLSGEDLSQSPPQRRAQAISYLPQEAPLPELWNVREIVEQGLTPHQRSPDELERARHELDWLCDQLDLRCLWHRAIRTLSGGERRRVLVARALSQNTRVILLDEPLASLDWTTQEHLMHILTSVCSRRKALMVLSLHEINLAAIYTDTSLLLARGEVIEYGETAEVLTQPCLARVFGVQPLTVAHPHIDRLQRLPHALIHLEGGSVTSTESGSQG